MTALCSSSRRPPVRARPPCAAALERDRRCSCPLLYHRKPRAGEVDGRDYRFIDAATFRAMRERGDSSRAPKFTETITVLRGLVGREDEGRPRRAAGNRLAARAPACARHFPPPSASSSCRPRLADWSGGCAPGQDSEEVIQHRLANAVDEMRHVAELIMLLLTKSCQTHSKISCGGSRFPSALSGAAHEPRRLLHLHGTGMNHGPHHRRRLHEKIGNRFQLTLAATYRARQLSRLDAAGGRGEGQAHRDRPA